MDGGEKMTPFRMQVLMDIGARVTKIMTTGAWHLTFEEMEAVLEMIQREIREAQRKNGAMQKEDTNVPENSRTEKDDEVSP